MTNDGTIVRVKGTNVPVSEKMAERLADTMFALSTPNRVQMLLYLLDGPHAVVDIMQALGMEQSAVSHQLRVLRDHALVKAERVGRRRLYALQDDHVRTLLEEAVRHVQHRNKPAKAPRALAGPKG
jgi:DNA-binding transcriptional ArsR family regulator